MTQWPMIVDNLFKLNNNTLNLVNQLYESIPEFAEINDPFFNEYDYTVYGNFGLFLEDVVQICSYGKITDQNYFSDLKLESRLLGTDLNSLISKSFGFIETTYIQGDDHARDVINTSFFKIVVTSKVLSEYSSKHMSMELNDKMHNFWKLK